MARTVVNVTASATLDGRDISADGTKLDGIEANATADQTAAEIKSLVEASSDIALAGNPTTTTQSSGNNSTRIATTAFVADATSGLATDTNLANKAPINSPTFTGTPAAPTASSGTNTTQIATTAFVTTAVAGATIDGISSSADATAITIDSNENVGIGTSPSAPLHVKVTESSTGETDPLIRFERFTSGDNAYLDITVDNNNNLIGFQSTGSSDGGFTFGGASTERMRIDSSGKVGIGTTSPVSPLDVKGTAPIVTANSNVFAGSGNGTGFGIYRSASGRTAGYTWTIENVIASGGSSSSDYQIDNLVFKNRASVSASSLTERMRISSAGNVGIGVTSPAAALDVAGTIKVSTGSDNVGVGGLTLAALTSGSDNVAVGYNVLNDLTTGTQNAAIGHAALDNLTTGSHNVAVGALSLTDLTTASYNTSVGRANLKSCTTGDANTSVGYYGMYTNTTGTYNTSHGTSSLQYNTTGTYNTGLGSSALLNCTTGNYNTGVGFQALVTQNTATHNVGMGYASGYHTTTGSGNAFIGNYSGYYHTTGSYSTYLGYQAGYNNTTGLYNTYVGGFAGYTASTANYSACVGYYSGFGLTTNGYHAFLGYYAGSNSTGTAYGNVCIGYNAQAGGTTNATGNQRHTSIVLGYNTLGVGTGYFTFGTGTGSSRVYNQFGSTNNTAWYTGSDRRYKKDIQDNTDCGLAFINDLRPVTFRWKAKSEIDSNLPDYDPNETEPTYTGKVYGLIAQEVKQALDDNNITDFGGWSTMPDCDVQTLGKEMFVFPLIKAVQELSAKVTALENGG